MSHGELVAAVLAVHVGLIPVAFAAYIKYGDWGEVLAKSLGGTDDLLRRMRQCLSTALKEGLDPIFANPGSIPSPIIDVTGNTYMERPVNPAGSEQYRECLRDFVEVNALLLAEYRAGGRAKTMWSKWARRRGWVLLLLCIYAIMLAGFVGIVHHVSSIGIPDSVLLWSFVPTAGLVASALASTLLCHWHQDMICSLREKYETT